MTESYANPPQAANHSKTRHRSAISPNRNAISPTYPTTPTSPNLSSRNYKKDDYNNNKMFKTIQAEGTYNELTKEP